MTEAVASPAVKTVEFDGVMENAYGKELETALSFDGSYEHILNFESIPAKELPDNDDLLTLVNNKRKANARQKAMQAVLDNAGIKKPTLENDRDLQIRTMVKVLVATGKTEAVARQIAETAIG